VEKLDASFRSLPNQQKALQNTLPKAMKELMQKTKKGYSRSL